MDETVPDNVTASLTVFQGWWFCQAKLICCKSSPLSLRLLAQNVIARWC